MILDLHIKHILLKICNSNIQSIKWGVTCIHTAVYGVIFLLEFKKKVSNKKTKKEEEENNLYKICLHTQETYILNQAKWT